MTGTVGRRETGGREGVGTGEEWGARERKVVNDRHEGTGKERCERDRDRTEGGT